MCASCNATDTNGHSNGTATNGTNGASHEGFTSIKSAHNPHPSHKSSPYAPVGDFLSNVSRFKIIGTSPMLLRARSEVRTRCNLSSYSNAHQGAIQDVADFYPLREHTTRRRAIRQCLLRSRSQDQDCSRTRRVWRRLYGFAPRRFACRVRELTALQTSN